MGPLAGVKVLELAGIGPAPMAAMMLADMGATVLRIERSEPSSLGIERPLKSNLTLRGRKAIKLNLKQPDSVEAVLKLVECSDALIEGFRPGVMERLGLGPDICFRRNPRVIYGRVTGWGQYGPLSRVAGHDLNYIALTGALHSIGRSGQPPTPPLTFLGDHAGGAAYLAFGVACALVDVQRSGQGQIVDAAIVDGVTHLMTSFYGMLAGGLVNLERGRNHTDSGAFYYDVYQCADEKWISIAPIEDKFYSQLLEKLGLTAEQLPRQTDRSRWEQGRAVLAEIFRTKTRDEWCDLLEGTDTCFSPVLSPAEAADHPHMKVRQTFVEIGGIVQPAPAPRFSRTKPEIPEGPCGASDTEPETALEGWLEKDEIERWRIKGVFD